MKHIYCPLLFAILLCMMAVATLSAHPDDRNSIYYYSNSSTRPMSFSLDDLDKLTFSDNGIQLWKQNVVEEISFDDFMLFTFSEIQHPIVTKTEQVLDSQDVLIRYQPGSKTVFVESRQALNGVAVYDLQGRMVANEATGGTSYRISLAATPAGIYLVKAKRGAETIVNKIVK